MDISIAKEPAQQKDVDDLLLSLNAHLTPLTPIEFQYQLTAHEMSQTDMSVFVARNEDGKAIGMGALRAHPNGQGEVKRMFTHPEARGQRVGLKLLNAIVREAQDKQISHLVLETGNGEGFEGAHRLYRQFGFQPCGPVLDYPASAYTAFYELKL